MGFPETSSILCPCIHCNTIKSPTPVLPALHTLHKSCITLCNILVYCSIISVNSNGWLRDERLVYRR